MRKIREIFQAVDDNDLTHFKDLLNEDPDLINDCEEHEQSVFWVACCGGRTDMVRFALENPKVSQVVDCRKPDKWWRFPLNAAQAFHCRNVEALLEQRIYNSPGSEPD